MTRRLVIIGGGPGGNTAATVAATLGAEVTLIERDVIGGAAHLWDCIPSKAMIATGGELASVAPRADHGTASRGFDRSRCAPAPGERHRGAAPPFGPRPPRVAGRAADARRGAVHRHPHRRGDGRRRDRTGERRRLRDRDRLPSARARMGAARRRASPHHSRGVPAAGDPVASLRHRIRGDRRRVHPHVQHARQRGDARRVASAGAPDQGPRGRRGARGRVPRLAACTLLKGARATTILRDGERVRVDCNDGRTSTRPT